MELLHSSPGLSGVAAQGYGHDLSTPVLWSLVGANAVIALACFSIPLVVLSFIRKRSDSALNPFAWLLGAFALACGVTSVMQILTLWAPAYDLQVLIASVTALVSVTSAVALWRWVPRALTIPSPGQLRTLEDSLEAEIGMHRSAQDHLVDTQQGLAVALASIGAGFIATDRDGRVTRLNAVAEQVTGWTQAEAQGRSLWEVYVREGCPPQQATANPVDVAIARGISVDTLHDVVAVSRDARRARLELRLALTHADDGTVRGLAIVFRDMTQLARAEAESARLAAIVDSSYDAIIGKTLDGHITSWNAAATAMFGYSADEAIGQSVQMLIPAQRKAEEMRILSELARGMRVPPFDTVRRAKDGSLLDVSLTISPIRDAQGRVIGASKIARDVSSQRRAEAALRESESRLRFTLESAQIGDWELDLVSGAARRSLWHDRCFGYETLQPEWGFDTFLHHVHPDDRAEVQQSFEDAVRDLEDWSVECRVVWPDASVHWISVHGSSVREPGKPARMLGIVIDVTMQKLAAQARLTAQRLEAENRQIQEASRLKSQFLANMSHELRTPLNAIIGFADLLHAGAVPPQSPKHREFLGHIGTSGRHLLQLINDVLDLSKVESGKFEFFPEPVRLPALVDEVRDVLHTSITRKHIELATELDPTLTDLVLDPARLKQVLYNYLSNAIKFTPEGGRVVVRALAEGPQHFRIEVADTGIGIAAADIPRLFVEFQQLDGSYAKQYAGTGLGLSLTRRLVQAQGGSVGVRSTPGVGSVFHLVLRRVPVSGASGDTAGHRLLVIEDDDREQSRLVRSLSDAGFRVDTASTGEQALQHALNTSYDAITLNLMLPDQRGLGVLADIRHQGPNREAPVVGMTMPANAGAAVGFAIADVLGKPIRADEVAAAMARFRQPMARRTRVLVIDDDALALDLMQATLGGIGIETVCRLDGRAALRDIERLRPDAVVLDLMMPGFDGFEVLDALQQMPSWRDTPVFIWTSMILTDDEYASLARSACAILSKGGGALAVMLEDLRRWRPVTILHDGAPP